MQNTHKQLANYSQVSNRPTRHNQHCVHEISGWLEKQRKVRGWVWKKYWFVLNGDQLGYYKQPDDQTSSRGLIDVNQARRIKEVTAGNRSYTFEIVTQSRTHILSAESVECRDRWMKILQSARFLRCPQSSIMERPSCDSISDVDDDYQNLSEEETNIPCSRMSINDDNVFLQDVPSGLPMTSSSTEDSVKATTKDSVKASISGHHIDTASQNGSTMVDQGVTLRDREVGEVSRENQKITSDGHSVVLRRSRASRNNTESLEISAIPRPDIDKTLQELDDKRIQELCESIKDINFDFPPIPSLPHPRLEMTWDSVFDQIRTFIAQNRAPKEVYATPRRSRVSGKAMKELKVFLAELDRETS